jgi:hypothetical protein
MRSLFLAVGIVAAPFCTAVAAPQIKQPDCHALEAWGAKVNNETYNVAPRLTLPKAFDDAEMVPLWGVGVLSWTPEDLQAANQLLTKCYGEAGKRRDGAAAGALANGNRALQGLVPRTNAVLQKAKVDAEPVKKQIDALPNSAELDRALGVLVQANPAAPDGNAYQGLPREVVEPVFHLAQIVLNLGSSERETIYASFTQRRTQIEAGLSADAEKAIAGAPADAGGIIAIMQARQRALSLSDAALKGKLVQSADQRLKEGRDALRQAKPAVWVPPDCLDLYRWATAPNAGVAVNVGDRGAIQTVFLDERVVPVFGLALGQWSDQDVANFKALRIACQSEAQAQAAVPGNTGPNAPELVQLAGKARWLDNSDRPVADTRTLLAAQHKGQEALSAALEKVKAMPDNSSAVAALGQLAADPSLQALSGADRTALTNAVNAKLQAIGAQAANAATKGLDDIKVASYEDLDKLWAYGAQSVATIPDPRNRQVFIDRFTHSLQEAAAGLGKGQADAKPASLASVAQVNLKLLQMNTAPLGVKQTPAFQAYVRAVEASRDQMARSARAQACTDLAGSVGAGSDAAQPLWNGREAITLGEFLCEAGEHGTVNSYAGPGMFSKTLTVKVTPLRTQILTISLHNVEVQAGKPMLVGFEIKDAAQAGGQAVAAGQPGYSPTPNGPITVEGWEIFIPNVVGMSGLEDEACMKMINDPAPDKFAPAGKVFYLNCWKVDSVRGHVAHAKGW